MKRSLIFPFILVGSLAVGAAQAQQAATDATEPADTQMTTYDPSTDVDDIHSYDGPSYDVDGVPSYLMRNRRTLDNGLLPTSPDAQG